MQKFIHGAMFAVLCQKNSLKNGLLEAAAVVISRGCWVCKSLLRCFWSCSWLLDPAMIGRGCYCRVGFDRLGDGCLRDVHRTAREGYRMVLKALKSQDLSQVVVKALKSQDLECLLFAIR
ncbi:hypothetical protein WN943_018241 [Citrus x changshan-huyou]